MTFEYLDTNEQLEQYCHDSSDVEYIAIDTEFVRTRTFYPQCGLIQINNGKQVVLVDPLAITDWTAFRELITNPSVIKVLHSCSEDLDVFWRLIEAMPTPLFDTQFAACLLGMGNTLGYAKLVSDLLDVTLDKGESRTDWLQRPLSKEQLVYAANDVVYLFRVYPILKQRIEELGRFDWVLEDGMALSNKKSSSLPAEYRYLSIKNNWQLSGSHLALLKVLAAWRYNKAVEKDLALNFVLKEAAMFAVARNMPTNISALQSGCGLTHKELRVCGKEVLDLVAQSRAIHEEEFPPRIKRLIDMKVYKKVSQAIKADCAVIAERESIPVEILSSKKQINQFLKWVWFEVEECKMQHTKPDMMLGWRHLLLESVTNKYLQELGAE